MSNTSSCADGILPSNTDTEGIGTRIAVYAQLFIAILTIALSPTRFWFHSWRELVWTSISLQVSVISQTSDLTLFDALVVTWLAFPIFSVSMATFIVGRWGAVLMPREVWLLTIAHALLFIILGLVVWSNQSSFGSCPTLNNSIQFVVLGLSVSPAGGIRPFAIAFNSVMLVVHVIGVTLATAKSKRGKIPRESKKIRGRDRKARTRPRRNEYDRMSSPSPLPMSRDASQAVDDERRSKSRESHDQEEKPLVSSIENVERAEDPEHNEDQSTHEPEAQDSSESTTVPSRACCACATCRNAIAKRPDSSCNSEPRATTRVFFLLFHLLTLALSVSSAEPMIIRNNLVRRAIQITNGTLVRFTPFLYFTIVYERYRAKKKNIPPKKPEDEEKEDESDENIADMI